MAYWTYRVNKELDKSYQIEYPVYRKRVSLVNYITRHSNPMMVFTQFEIVDIARRDADTADVKMKVDLRLKAPGAKAFDHDAALTERWIRSEGQWYHVPGRIDDSAQDNKS